MRYLFLKIEFFFIFILIPLIVFFFRFQLKKAAIPLLLIFFLICMFILVRKNGIKKELFWNTKDIKKYLPIIVRNFCIGSVLLAIVIFFTDRNILFNLPLRHLPLWVLVTIVYPLFSVYPQELIFRLFIWERYKPLFSSSARYVVMSSVSFGLYHLIYGNPVAPVLSALGGMLFALTFIRSRSIVLSSIEHSLWGNFIFTIGLEAYFYSGIIN